MPAPKLMRRLFWAAELLLLAGTLAAAVWISRAGEWQPLPLVALLLVLTLLGDWLSIETPAGELSCALVAIVLVMGLLGPVPAMAFSTAGTILISAMRRLTPPQWLSALSTFAIVPFTGGLIVRVSVGNAAGLSNPAATQSVTFGLVLLGAFMVAVGLNFVLFALHKRVDEGRPLVRQMHELFLPLLPGQLAAGMLATLLAVAYASVGLSMLIGSIAVLLILRQLTVALLRSEDRAEELQARSRQLVGLQLGVLRTLVRALGMRDKTSGRHAASVARYAKALAIEIGCGEEECDVVHAAGLLHEIGKFTWPDRVLHGEAVEDEDLAIVKNHPQEGSILVGALDGYGDVADAILYHHERVDGRGYPAGLIGKEIPLASRILAICSIYDTITARESYRSQMTPQEAMAELRHAADNGQLDSELVESFIAVLEREGPTFAQEADFETELEFERRVRQMAEPRAPEPASRPSRPTRPRPGGGDWRASLRALRLRTPNKG
ncbi:MAG TPA: HD domain-containing phosphohydrolase [Solirubrobacteraceae bacterium]|nr:HD domain-containing phosphohydrolase [Solirubrobacteraceae bacterium]